MSGIKIVNHVSLIVIFIKMIINTLFHKIFIIR